MKYLAGMLLIPIGCYAFTKSPVIGVLLVIIGAGVLIAGLFTGDLPLFGSKR